MLRRDQQAERERACESKVSSNWLRLVLVELISERRQESLPRHSSWCAQRGELRPNLSRHFLGSQGGQRLVRDLKPLLGPQLFPPGLRWEHARPFLLGPQRGEDLDSVVARRVGAVVGPADRRHEHFHLGVARHDLARLADILGHTLHRAIQREGGGDPQVAFLELRHELPADKREHTGGRRHHPAHDEERCIAVLQAFIQLPQVTPSQEAHQDVVVAGLQVLQEVEAQHRRQGAGQDGCLRPGRKRRSEPWGRTTALPARSW